jgi:hypothetical protein
VDTSDVSKALALVLCVGAAVADADEGQRRRLLDELQPMLPQIRADGVLRPSVEKLMEIMGEDWSPGGEYDIWLRRLGWQLR